MFKRVQGLYIFIIVFTWLHTTIQTWVLNLCRMADAVHSVRLHVRHSNFQAAVWIETLGT